MLPVYPFRQRAGHCGPSSLKIVLEYFGTSISEKRLAKLSGCTPSKGIDAAGFVQAAKKLGFHAFVKDFADLADIRQYVRTKKIPVIVDWFSGDEGHYSVVVGINRDNIQLFDPELGHHRAFRLRDFKRIWFDFPGEYLRSKNDIIIRRMVVVHPRKKR